MSHLTLIAAPFLLAAALQAQTTQTVPYSSIYTPEIHLGSADTPSTITVPPVVEVSGTEFFTPSPLPLVDNAPPASTALLATRHFDFITSPLGQVTRGSMEDTSISLGEYARQLRASKQAKNASAAPSAMAQPTRAK